MAAKMKYCKACGKEIAKSAKVCPFCGAKQKGKLGLIILGIIAVFVVIGLIGGKSSNSGGSNTSSSSSSSGSQNQTAASSTSEPEKIDYTPITVAELEEALDKNAMNAADTYKGNYYAVEGALSTIDSDGKYISIEDPNADFTFFTVHCNIKSDEVKEKIKTLSAGDVITVYGKITDVGEVLGYYLDIDSIE